MATKKKAKAKAASRPGKFIFEESGSPIIIGGGGSMSLHFDHGHYPPTTAGTNPPEYQDPSGKEEIAAVLVINKHGRLFGSALAATGTNCEVTVTNRNGGGVTFSSTAAAGLKIHFDDPANFPFDDNRRVFYNSSGKLSAGRVVVNNQVIFDLDTNDPPSNPRVLVVILNRRRP